MEEQSNNPLTDAKPGTTHILINYPTQQSTHLFRASDGMMLGMRIQFSVKWGITAETTQSRVFMNEACALECLKAAAYEDMATQDTGQRIPIFEERDGEPQIEVASPHLLRRN